MSEGQRAGVKKMPEMCPRPRGPFGLQLKECLSGERQGSGKGPGEGAGAVLGTLELKKGHLGRGNSGSQSWRQRD